MIRMLWDQIRAVVLTLLISDAAILFLNYLYVNKLDLWLFYSVLILVGIALYTGFKVFEIKKFNRICRWMILMNRIIQIPPILL